MHPHSHPVYRSATHLAEVASAGVRYNLAVDDQIAASALQPVARAAWELVHNPQAVEQLRQAVHSAEATLAMACGVSDDRQFLADALRYLDDPGEREIERHGLSTRVPRFARPGEADLKEARLLGALASIYFHAAAALSEGALLIRAAATPVDLDFAADEFIDETMTSASEALTQAVSAYGQVVDLLSLSAVASQPDVARHLDELRLRTGGLLNLARISLPDENPQPPDPDNPDEPTDAEMVDFFLDEADLLDADTHLMLACGDAANADARRLTSS